MNKEDLIGNVTTIIKAISMIIAGYTVGIAVSLGLNLPFTEAQIADAISIIIFIILAFLDAKYQNTIICNNNTTTTETTEPTIKVEVTNDELSEAIKEAAEDIEPTQETVEVDVIGDDQQ